MAALLPGALLQLIITVLQFCFLSGRLVFWGWLADPLDERLCDWIELCVIALRGELTDESARVLLGLLNVWGLKLLFTVAIESSVIGSASVENTFSPSMLTIYERNRLSWKFAVWHLQHSHDMLLSCRRSKSGVFTSIHDLWYHKLHSSQQTARWHHDTLSSQRPQGYIVTALGPGFIWISPQSISTNKVVAARREPGFAVIILFMQV